MATEVEWQANIRKSFERQGGFGRKWSSEWQAGNPDLVLAYPGFGLGLMEVKKIKRYNRRVVAEKINVTTKQQLTMKQVHHAGGQVCIGVVIEWSLAFRELFLKQWEHVFISADLGEGIRWVAKEGFDVEEIVRRWRELYA